jgi:hypothetical protein
MPRDGSNIYHTPSGTDAVSNTTISSTAYNTNVHDVETDLNTPRPIVAGGTGASSATAALTNLGSEQAKQVITNFASATFAAGSFYAATTATGGPVASHAFAGICYAADASNMVLEARDLTDTTYPVYYRVMSGGVWGAWSGALTATGLSSTGSLSVSAYGQFYYNANTAISNGVNVGGLPKATAGNSGFQISSNDLAASQLFGWAFLFTDPIAANRRLQIGCVEQGIAFRNITLAESGGYVGIGKAVPASMLDVAGAITSEVTATTGSYYFGNSGTVSLQYNGSAFTLTGGPLYVNDPNMTLGQGGNNGAIRFGNSGSAYLYYDGTQFALNGGPLTVAGNVVTPNLIAVPRIQTFAGAGGTYTYTPNSHMVYCQIECIGGGGAGGGTPPLSGTASAAAGGGGSGAYSRKIVAASAIGASKTVTVGAGGTCLAGGNGTAGGDSSLGTLCVAKGGNGASIAASQSVSIGAPGGLGSSGTGDVVSSGGNGATGAASLSAGTYVCAGGSGGAGFFGSGGNGQTSSGGGTNGAALGSGGGGAAAITGSGAFAGGSGAPGVVIITEYCSQ